jgi:hypothetical protein
VCPEERGHHQRRDEVFGAGMLFMVFPYVLLFLSIETWRI